MYYYWKANNALSKNIQYSVTYGQAAKWKSEEKTEGM